MSYVHCHSCEWQQDDFWSKSYNPVRFFFGVDFPAYIRPRMIRFDPHFWSTSPVAAFFGLAEVKTVPWAQKDGPKCVDVNTDLESKMVRVYEMHSWYVLWRQFRNKVRRLFTQRWWTYESWRKALKKGKGGCPECGNSLCID